MSNTRTLHRIPSLVLCLAVSIILPTAAKAQSPFPRPATTPTPWTTNSTLDIANANVRLRLAYSAAAGARLAEVQSLPGGYTFLFETPAITEPDNYFLPTDGIWQARLQGVGTDDEYLVRPSASNLTVYDNLSVSNANPKEVLLVWNPVSGAGLNNVFWVEVRLRLATGARHVTVDTKMGRIGTGASGLGIQDVISPLFCVRGPAAPVGNERHIDAQVRSRVLVPIAMRGPNGDVTPSGRLRDGSRGFMAVNSMLRSWLFGEASGGQLEHPNPGQNMQFSALYSDDDSNRGNMLWVSTLDANGWFKRLRQTSYESDTHVQYYSWGSVYYPSYTPTEGSNGLDAPYPAAIGALRATSDAWWYDAAEYYRNVFVGAQDLPRAGSDGTRRHRGWDERGVFMHVNNLKNTPQGVFTQSHWNVLHDKARAYNSLFSDAAGAPNMFVETHQYLDGGFNPDGCVCITPPTSVDLLHPNWNPRLNFGIGQGTADLNKLAFGFLQQCDGDGFNTGVYYHPTLFQSDRIQATNGGVGILRRRRDELIAMQDVCQPCPTDPAYAQGVDYGDLANVTGMMPQMLNEMASVAPFLRGSYWDAFGGSGAKLRYGQASGNVAPYHGNMVTMAGKRATAEFARDFVNSLSPAPRSSKDTAWLATESCEEGLADEFDWQHIGYLPWANEILLRAGPMEAAFGAPLHTRFETSHPFPPLWSAVYHEFAPPQCLIGQLVSHCLAPADGGEAGAAAVAVTPTELADTRCYAFALAWILGYRVSLFEWLDDEVQNYRMIDWNPATSTWRLRPGLSTAAQAALGPMANFLSQLNATMNSLGAGFLNVGRSERPLLPAYDPANPTPAITLAFHPVLAAMLKIGGSSTPALQRGVGSADFAGFYGDLYQLPVPAGFERIPAVLHSVWSDPSAPQHRIGIAIANWTNAPATFQATFDPARYGLPNAPSPKYSIVKYTLGQTPQTLFSSATGPVALSLTVPARTCSILVAQ